MKIRNYETLKETLYEETLVNGLRVTLLPKEGFHKTYGLFTTNYGSVDNEFVPLDGEDFIRVPDGIAHFLEHKMFEKQTGDIFQTFSKQGAAANAFTSFTRTSYLFSSTVNIFENVATLLDFVQDPYFTEQTVEKEKGIIAQEIKMYQDEPDWRLFFGIIGNLFPKHPLHIDIAGTVESITKITAEDLYTCYHTFYHPSNMNLFLVGNFDPEQMMTFIKENQIKKTFVKAKPILRRFPEENISDIIRQSSIEMPVNRSKAIFGIKGLDEEPTEEREQLKYRLHVRFLLQLLLGNTSENYQRLYNQGLIDDSFGFEFNSDRSFHFADFGSDTDDPQLFLQEIRRIVGNANNDKGLTEQKLELLKKKMIGKFLQSLNSLEYIANQFSQTAYDQVTLFDRIALIEETTLADILIAAGSFLHAEGFSEFVIKPKNSKV